MTLVAGVDTSTQSCKIVVKDADTGDLVRQGRAAHPDATEVSPEAWWDAFCEARRQAGGLDDVAAISVGGQQHGMVCLDADGAVVRDALLWNDTRSAGAAEQLIAELGQGDADAGKAAWAQATGSVPVASITLTKLRWLRDNEPEAAARVAAVCLPHDYLGWRIAREAEPGLGIDALWTDRSDASGTGYWSPTTGDYRPDLLELGFGRVPHLPRLVGPLDVAHRTPSGVALGPGAGDNAAAALGLGMGPGDVALSVGTSGVVSAINPTPVQDPSGLVTGFADATGAFLPLCATLNGARVLAATADLLGVDFDVLDDLALSAPPGAGGLTYVPYLEGERTPNRPFARGSLHGISLANLTPANLARASVEGLLCLLADGLDAMRAQGVTPARLLLIGGGARSRATSAIAPAVLGQEIVVPPPGEYVADGAARQAAACLTGALPDWQAHGGQLATAEPQPAIREQYARARDLVLETRA